LLKKNQLVQMPIQIKCMRHIRLFPTLGWWKTWLFKTLAN
jgi:hypothetical protein